MRKFRPGAKKGLHFTTKQGEKTRKTRLFLAAFCIFVVGFGGIALFVLLQANDFSVSRMFGAPETTAPTAPVETETQPPQAAVELSGRANLLFAGLSEEETLVYAVVVHVDLDRQSFRVCALPVDAQAAVGAQTASLFDHYRFGGGEQLARAVEAYGKAPVSRYFCSTYSNMKKIVRLLGNTMILDLSHAIQYQSDAFSLKVQAGEQTVKGDVIAKLLYCPDTGANRALDTQALVVSAMIDQFLNAENVGQGDKLFRELIDLGKSNITARDFARHQPTLAALANSEQRQNAQPVGSLDGFE